jgi:hypothetical protein
MKKGQLLQYDTQLQTWVRTGDINAVFNKQKINAFYQEFGIRLQTISKDLDIIRRKYLVYEGEQVKTIEQNGQLVPVLIDISQAENFTKEITDFMNSEISAIRLTKIN